MNPLYIIAGIIFFGLLIYLFFTLLGPEKFE